MFLKSIKARGFKSFARPVEFGFQPGITVVVGPNGSGKSNISDAVVWAMGEQSPSAVRGASMQDIIFSGSDKMAPAGMAEVEILLDNSLGLLPIEFSEVMVSRRLYRDGEGQYFINRSACRLIDVTELLSDAGLGRDGHSIISQGKVDSILESKPIERRSHIEEAAGLGKFKKRRRRAEHKLAAVRRNLERLADVEEEVKSNLRPLKRQATAAERSSKLDQQIAVSQTQLIKGRLEVLTAELEAAETASRNAGARRTELEQELAATAEERRRTEELLSSSLQEHKRLAARFYSLKSQKDSLANRREAMAERRDMLSQAGRRAEAKIENLKGQAERVASELERTVSEHELDVARMIELETTLTAKQGELATAEAELNRRREASEEKSRKVGELAALRDRYTHQQEYLSQRKQKLAASIERATQEAAAHRREIASLDEQTREEESRLQGWREKSAAAESALKKLIEQRAELEARRQEIVSELRRVGEDLQIAKARLTFIGDSDRDRSGLPPAAKQIAIDHSVKALVELIDVESGYEQAVSAVLGNMLFALAVDGAGQAGELLAKARTARLGSVEFLLPQGNAAAEARREGEDYLIDHVKVSGGQESRVAALLTGVRVVNDDSHAGGEESGADSDGHGSAGGAITDSIASATEGTLVTRDGVVFHAGRRLLSYKADPPSSVVLRQRNERRHLDDERETAEARHVELEAQIERMVMELADVDRRRADAERESREVTDEMREVEASMGGIDRKRRVLQQEAEIKEASRAHLETEDRKIDEDLAEAVRSLEETDRALTEAGVASGAAPDEDDEALAARRQELSGKVTELQITAARVRERERVGGQAIERIGPSLERLRREQNETSGQLAAYRRLEPACVALHASIEKLAVIFENMAGGLESQLRDGEEQSNLHSTSLRELSTAEAGLQQELSRASDASTEREVSVTRLRDHVEEQASRLVMLKERHPDAGLDELEPAPASELEIFEEQIERLERRRELIGPVNPLAQQEYEEMVERQSFLTEQRADLEKSLDELTGLIRELTDRIETNFTATFEAVRQHFTDVVGTLFPGGEGRLTLVEPDTNAVDADGEPSDEAEAIEKEAGSTGDRRGIEISVKPARKALRSLQLFSGGERSLVAIAFLFAIFLARPAPFYILDEVEAALDDMNIDRLLSMLRRYQNRTQFIVITHQKRTMEVADVLYGVSMGADGTSKVLSRKMPAAEFESEDSSTSSEAGLEQEESVSPAANQEDIEATAVAS
ncbi:MAG: chromosome segregation protein SMC [Thermoleophilia bacterium]|nr:chromosome segregation protein SMC [Thermoleophilia bacterium]